MSLVHCVDCSDEKCYKRSTRPTAGCVNGILKEEKRVSTRPFREEEEEIARSQKERYYKDLMKPAF